MVLPLSLCCTATPAKADELGNFPQTYIDYNRGRASFHVPEAYELANIILAMSEYGQKEPWVVFKNSTYYKSVEAHFGRHRDHPLFAALNLKNADQASRYYEFRENSASYCFNPQGRIILCKPWGVIWGEEGKPNAWADNLKLIEDFARATGFRRFYWKNLGTYERLIARYRNDVDLTGMKRWLERHFSARWDAYTIVFSPLIYGSHSTARQRGGGFGEVLMFTAAPWIVSNADDGIRRAEIARMLFTEIDHNYVNPATNEHAPAVEKVFGLPPWGSSNQSMYRSPTRIFNEYMTWAVFNEWARDTLSADVAARVTADTSRQMEQQRGFHAFGKFDEALSSIRRSVGSEARIEDLYPGLISWAAEWRGRETPAASEARPGGE